jgi:hypothetical protein
MRTWGGQNTQALLRLCALAVTSTCCSPQERSAASPPLGHGRSYVYVHHTYVLRAYISIGRATSCAKRSNKRFLAVIRDPTCSVPGDYCLHPHRQIQSYWHMCEGSTVPARLRPCALAACRCELALTATFQLLHESRVSAFSSFQRFNDL